MTRPPGAAFLGALIVLVLGAPGCDSIQGPDDDPASIELSAGRSDIGLLGDTVHLTAVVRSGGGEILPDAPVAWSSRSPALVDVDESGIVIALGNGSAWVVASSGAARDSIRLTVSSAIPCGLAGTLPVPGSESGALVQSDCQIGGHHVDAWRITLEQELQFTVELSSDAFDALLVLLDANGNQIAIDDDGAGGVDSRITVSLPAGPYFIYATSFGTGATGGYELTAFEGVPDSPCPAMAAVSFPDTVSGTVTGDACDFDGFYLDVWRLEISTDTVVVLQVESDDFEPVFVVADTLGGFLEFSGSGPGTSAWLEVALDAGSYDIWLGAGEMGRTGSYTLAVRPGPTTALCEAAGALTLPETVAGELTPDDCFLFFSSADPWDVELMETTTVGLSLSAAGFEPVILISDATGEVIDGFVDEGSVLEEETTLPAGAYRVWVLAAEGGHGSYDLAVSTAGQLPDCEPDGSLAVGDTVHAALATNDCRLPPGRYADSWTTRLDSATAVTVLLASDKFAPYLIVADSTGSRIIRDLDAGGSGSAAVTIELDAGLYQLWATSLQADRVGAYTLAILPDAAGSGHRARSGSSGGEAPSDRWRDLLDRGSKRGGSPWSRWGGTGSGDGGER